LIDTKDNLAGDDEMEELLTELGKLAWERYEALIK
jgi:hypothetical protein